MVAAAVVRLPTGRASATLAFARRWGLAVDSQARRRIFGFRGCSHSPLDLPAARCARSRPRRPSVSPSRLVGGAVSAIAICVNPLAGRDVRRVAARASTMTFEAKRDAVARIAVGADAAGATDIFVVEEPFRIASMALEWVPLQARVHILETPLRHDATDTQAAVAAYLERDVGVIVSLGGDGTNRAIVSVAKDIDLIPLSTGTNNAFPVLIEPTIAGMAAGLAARNLLPEELRPRCKLLHVRFSDGASDVAVVDAAYLEDDFTGNMRPFDAAKLRRVMLTRAEPDAIGMSPIGGFVDVVEAADDCGLLVDVGAGRHLNAPLSPGLFRALRVGQVERISFGAPVSFQGQGVLALDGDRDHKLNARRRAAVTIRRDGPRVVDVAAAMRFASKRGLIAGNG